MKNRLILIVRAFNDFDCRLPILYHYSKLYPKNSEIFVVPIPTNKGYGNFITNEITNEINLSNTKNLDVIASSENISTKLNKILDNF